MANIIDTLLSSEDPSIRYKARVKLMGEDAQSKDARTLREEIRSSPRVKALLSDRVDGRIPWHPYAKWWGAHWVLASLADLQYPIGDKSLFPLRDQVLDWLLGSDHLKGKPVEGRARRCGSQEGNALWAILSLGLDDGRAEELARNLMKWQWDDGGWNCDRNPEAAKSSFHETILPLRGLALFGRLRDCEEAVEVARRASEVFLRRRMFRRLSDGSVMRETFVQLHYPAYWHYDILIGLKVMREAGFIGDPRCHEALDVLEGKRLASGGFAAASPYYHSRKGVSGGRRTGNSLVDWGPARRSVMNEFVTADALFVLGSG